MAALLDRAADRLPDHERPPSPADSEMAALLAGHAREAQEYRKRMDRKMASINRMERALWVMAACLAAGLIAAAALEFSGSRPGSAEFLRERPE
jgi:hypothetical protein